MFYTGKGDNGKTELFGCDQKISKSSVVIEALGSLDELNAFLGICKVKAGKQKGFAHVIGNIQQDLFIIQAELAGSKERIKEEKIKKMEEAIDEIEKVLPPIRTFSLSGGTEFSASLDYARTLTRNAERSIVYSVEAAEDENVDLDRPTLVYLNRLSSLLYAMTRLTNVKSGIKEESPHY